MPGSSSIRRHAGLTGIVLLVGALAACTSGTVGASATPAAASPVVVASPTAGAVSSPTPVSPSPSVGAASPTPQGGGRYGGGGTPTPPPKATPAPSTKTVTVRAASTSLGKVLVGPNGLTLYTLSSDGMNRSTCNTSCAGNWPPLTVKSGTKVVGGTGVKGTFTTITRADGTHQVTYRGKPLYYFAGDGSAGDTNGEGIGGVWYVAKP
jgi:predicted lipoprotein with Yx(FWY)xxD motif